MSCKPNSPSDFSEPNHSSTQVVAIDKLVQKVIDAHEANLLKQNIVIETDLSTVRSVADTRLIRTAFGSLIKYANELMTHGGELAITLIDARYHWELEVVDNVERFPKSQDELNVMFSEPLREDTMPGVLPLSANRHLKRAYQAAISHGGQLQTWNCPEGGTAHVLVIPKRRNMTCQSRVA